MGFPLSTDDGTSEDSSGRDNNSGSAGSYDFSGGFDSLEERVYETKRHEDEATPSVRIESWMKGQIEIIKTELNTSRAEVMAKAYIEGVKNFRREITLEEIKNIQYLRIETMKLVGDVDKRTKKEMAVDESLQSMDINIRDKYEGDKLKQVNVPIPESLYAEVTDNYMSGLGIGVAYHRAVLASGLSTSVNSTRLTERYSEQMMSSLIDAIQEAREEIEEILVKYLGVKLYDWCEQNLTDGQIDEIESMIQLMETEHRKVAEFHLETLRMRKEVGDDWK